MKKMLHQKDQMILEKEKKVQPLACFPHAQHAGSWHITHITLKPSLAFHTVVSRRLSGCFQAAPFPKLKRLSGPTWGKFMSERVIFHPFSLIPPWGGKSQRAPTALCGVRAAPRVLLLLCAAL